MGRLAACKKAAGQIGLLPKNQEESMSGKVQVPGRTKGGGSTGTSSPGGNVKVAKVHPSLGQPPERTPPNSGGTCGRTSRGSNIGGTSGRTSRASTSSVGGNKEQWRM